MSDGRNGRGGCLTRRGFMERCAGALAASVTLDAVACGRETGHPVFAAAIDVSGLMADDQAIVAPMRGFDGAGILVVRKSAHDFVAFSMQCTHEGCPVNPPVNGVIRCPCHGSQYDLNGNVRHGPAQYSLARYDTDYSRWRKRLRVSMDESQR